MKKKRNFIFAVLTGAGALLTATCDKATNPPPPPVLELLFPKGGGNQSFKVGETVTIRWSIHDRDQIGSVGIPYSLDGGKSWSKFYIGNDSFIYPDTTCQWTIDSTYISDKFVLKIFEYTNHTPADSSAPFVISK